MTSSMQPWIDKFDDAKKVMAVREAVGDDTEIVVNVLADYKVADIGFFNQEEEEWQA